MPNRLKDKTALVIGAARGIGAGIAEVFAEEGAKLVIADALEAEGQATAARLSQTTETMPSAWTSAARPTTGRWWRPPWRASAASTSWSRTPASIPSP
jgi:NAD(P)-dependent dehydrogenase (short-subunit alcohol dehydrogenase family)